MVLTPARQLSCEPAAAVFARYGRLASHRTRASPAPQVGRGELRGSQAVIATIGAACRIKGGTVSQATKCASNASVSARFVKHSGQIDTWPSAASNLRFKV